MGIVCHLTPKGCVLVYEPCSALQLRMKVVSISSVH